MSLSLFQAVILVPFRSYGEQTAVNHSLHFQQALKALGFHPVRLAKGNGFKSQSDMFVCMQSSY